MKKLVLTTVCTLVVSGIAFAQGTINWSSISPAAMTAQTNSVTYSPLFGGGSTGLAAETGGNVGATTATSSSFYYELLYMSTPNTTGIQVVSPSLSSLTDGTTWLDTGFGAVNATTASRLSPISPNVAAVAPWAPGVSNNIVLVGWSANLGTDWATVQDELANWSTEGIVNAFFGVSATGFIMPNTAPANGATLFNGSHTANGLPINSLNTQLYLLPVPEPTTIALAGLGGLSLLLFRRRKV